MKRSPLKRTSSLKRSGRIEPVSKKRRALMPKRTDTRKLVLERAGLLCEANLEDCSIVATDVHEILTRARGGSITDPENCLALCRNCHRFITENPKWSDLYGFTVSSWSGIAGLNAAERERNMRRWDYGSED